MKKTTLLFALLLMGATVVKAQAEQKDFDDKYATELVKTGTADDYLARPESNHTSPFSVLRSQLMCISRSHSGARLLGIVVSRLPEGCTGGGTSV